MNIGTDWIAEIKNQLDSTFFDKNTLVFSGLQANGYIYSKKIMPGLMVQIVDFTSLKEIEFTRLSSNEDFYILNYIIGSDIRSQKQEAFIDKDELIAGFTVVPSHVVTRYISVPFERRFSVVITISKFLFEDYLGGSVSKAIKNKNFNFKNSVYCFNHIDSRTMVLLLKLKELQYDDPSFRFLVKGNALQILGYSITRLKREDNLSSNKLKYYDYDQIVKSQDYLIAHLNESFPGVDFLSEMSGMSTTKYKDAFKIIYQYAPKQFFVREKLSVAKNMLKSGGYRSIKSIAFDLGFGSVFNFSRLYFLRFGVLPKDHFIKFK